MKKVLITRQIEQSIDMINLISARGFLPYTIPLIETVPIAYNGDKIHADMLIFSSENAVKYYIDSAYKVTAEKFIAVGEKTEAKFKTLFGSKEIYLPKNYDMNSIITELKTSEINKKTIVILSAKEHIETDLTPLVKMGADIKRVALYETVNTIYIESYLDNFIKANDINVITFCSPSAVKSFINQSKLSLPNFEVIAIGKTTADYLLTNGVTAKYPTQYTIKAMIDII